MSNPAIQLGNRYSLPAIQVTGSLIDDFARLTGDMNPVHLDAVYAARTWCRERIAHGAYTNSLISAVLGMAVPQAPNVPTVYMEQLTKFVALVKIGDTLQGFVEVEELINAAKGVVKFKAWVSNQSGETVAIGHSIVKVDPSLLK